MRRIITFEEKIDYIYNDLRAQKRAKIFRFLLIFWAIWWVIVFFNWTERQDIIDASTKVLWNIVKPITQRVIDDMVTDMGKENWINTENIQNWLMHEVEKNPTILDNFDNNAN